MKLTFHSDISEAFPNGEFANFFRADWLTQMARDTRGTKDFSSRTQDTARWARDQIKRQSGKSNYLLWNHCCAVPSLSSVSAWHERFRYFWRDHSSIIT